MARQFKIEHLAVKPRGYKVRSVRRGAHIVRIAFPPGRRKKGSGIPLEVLHPLHENPGCRYSNPAELVVMANPSDAETATRTYEDFHGLPSQYIDTVEEPSPRSKAMAELGDLLEIRVHCAGGWKWRSLPLQGRNIKLASNAAGTQLYCVGGDQSLSRGDLSACNADASKEMIDLGEARYIAYRTRKSMVGGKLASYEHRLGEETGRFPRLMYDRRGSSPRLVFSGGEYHVKAEGIVN